MVNCWKEAVATGLQLAVFHALEAANDPDGGAESGIQGLHSALLPQAIPPHTQQQGSLHVLTSLINPTNKSILRPYLILCTGSTPSRRRRRLPCNARTLANSYSFSAPTTSRSATTSSQDTCSVNAKLLNLWNFERHRSHATRDRKRTAHVSTNNIERVSHRIRRLLSARVCRLLNVCLRRLSIGSESHLTVA